MKNTKVMKWFRLATLGVALPLLGSNSLVAATNLTVWTFPAASGSTDVSYAWQAPNWGGSTVAFDAAQDAQNNPNSGSVYITASVPNANGANGLVVTPFWPLSYPDTQYHDAYSGTTAKIDLTQYTNIEFDLKWDTANSTDPIDTFNSVPPPYGDGGIKFQVADQANNWILITNFNIPDAASNGWVHINIPINPATPGISQTIGAVFQKYWNGPAVGNPITVGFWIDNFKLDASTAPVPPPTVASPQKPSKGLNTIATSSGQYDRHIARLLPNAGRTWVGHATAATPVTYTFTINTFPQDPSTFYGAEALVFLVPNPTQNEASAPDWNEASVVQIYIQQQNANQSQMNFQYKANEPNGNTMYYGGTVTIADTSVNFTTNIYSYTMAPGSLPGGPITNVISPGVFSITNETGNLGSVSYAGTAVGTWSVKFTSDSNVILTAPDGTTNSFGFPAYNATGYFAETSGFNVDLGMQPNAVNAIGKTIAYSNFAISNTAAPFYDNFLTDTFLDTTNIWDVSMSSANSIVLVPASAAYSLSWTLPADQFTLEVGTNLQNLASWTPATKYPVINGSGIASQLVDSNEVPAGNLAFFNLVKRSATQLQVLLPGETNAPNTATGKTGTPTPLSFGSSGGVINVTINAVDSTWHIVNATDVVHVTDNDGSVNGLLPQDTALQNGTLTEQVAFGGTGTYTITASDTTSTNILSNTSSSVTVGP